MHPSPSNNLLVPAGGGSGCLPGSPGTSRQHSEASEPAADDPDTDSEELRSPVSAQLAPSLITCASTMHETSSDAIAEALEAALAAEGLGNGVRRSQLDDVPDEAANSPRNEARCDSPFSNVQK